MKISNTDLGYVSSAAVNSAVIHNEDFLNTIKWARRLFSQFIDEQAPITPFTVETMDTCLMKGDSMVITILGQLVDSNDNVVANDWTSSNDKTVLFDCSNIGDYRLVYSIWNSIEENEQRTEEMSCNLVTWTEAEKMIKAIYADAEIKGA